MTTYLLDSSVLIAATTLNHINRQRTRRWAKTVTRFAVCPITEGSLIRHVLFSKHSIKEAQITLRNMLNQSYFEFWPDDLSYADADLGNIIGHKQVTDAYLAALTRTRPGAKLATLDVALSKAHPDVVELIP